jgi:hypothetical protein
MKDYSNQPRKPMMYGGTAKKKAMAGGMATGMSSPNMMSQKTQTQAQQPRVGMGGMSVPPTMMYGGKAKKKMAEGGSVPMTDKEKKAEYDRLMAKKDKTPEERRRMMTIGKELGLVEASATEGRQSLD